MMRKLILSCLISLLAFTAKADKGHMAIFQATTDSIPLAKEILAEWEQNGPRDGDFYSAKYNLHIRQAIKYELTKSRYMPLYATERHMVFKDSLHNISHYMYAAIQVADSTQLDSALTWLKEGIERFPGRLDLRLAHSTFYRMMDNSQLMYEQMEKTVDYAMAHPDSIWTWTCDEPVKQDEYPVEENIQEYFTNCNSSSSHKAMEEKFLDLGLRLSPTNAMFWNDKAALRLEAGDIKGALEILEAALKQNPDSKFLSKNIEQLKELLKE